MSNDVHYWFFSPKEAGGEEPVGPRPMLMARHILDSEGSESIFLFVQVIEGTPGEDDMIDEVDRWTAECTAWIRESVKSGKPQPEWERPPHDFVIFHEDYPGEMIAYGPRHPADDEDISAVAKIISLRVAHIWPRWSALYANLHQLDKPVGEA